MLTTGIEMLLHGELKKDKCYVVSYFFFSAFFLCSGKMIEFHAVN